LDKAQSWLKKRLNYEFGDPDLLLRALTHRSAHGSSNERLEFLGDAVLDTVVSEVVYRSMPDAPEGDLSRVRSSLVKDSSLAAIAAGLGLGEHLILGVGERKSGGHRRESILADGLEALFGAVYLDAGYENCRQLIERVFGERFVELPDPSELRDPKTRLQEWLQARGLPLPRYEVTDVSGKAHQRRFEVSCVVDGAGASETGSGASRRSAEQKSAERMLRRLKESANGG
jgi:ribonuclease-3